MDNKKIPTCLGTAILVVMAITAGAFVWVYEQNQGAIETDTIIQTTIKKDQKTDTGKETVANTPQQFPEMDPAEKARLAALTKDWQTYRDTEYGYEFKYPQNYFVVNKKGTSSPETLTITSNKGYPGDGGCPKPPCNFPTHPHEITITVFEEPNNFSLTEIKKRLEGNYVTMGSEKYILINGKSALYYRSYQYSDAIYIVGYKKTYFISSDLEWIETYFSDTFKGIYSTFKEID